ncbi:SAM-dependent methyltransferase [Streptomyces sodiiphilus]|uniref:SAM-dependent methyltransferase n=1 Tax=Streptomyces sodiiphilus TaxID=226217 RepID=A0ABN2PG80_9ACTN
MTDGGAIPGMDLTRPSIARAYDYMLGGKDNYAVDREVGDQIKQNLPGAQAIAVENRKALVRAVREMTAGRGMRQFLDIGSGLPTADNVHQVAQRHAPGTRVVYVDNDPVVLAHGRALLEENDRTTVVQADLREPQRIRDDAAVRKLIDFDRPVGVVLCAILHHLNDDEDPAAVVRYWIDQVPSGSFFYISHFRTEHNPETAEIEGILQQSFGRGRWRDDDEIRALFEGLEIVEPGLVPTTEWMPDHDGHRELTVWERMIVAALAVKP